MQEILKVYICFILKYIVIHIFRLNAFLNKYIITIYNIYFNLNNIRITHIFSHICITLLYLNFIYNILYTSSYVFTQSWHVNVALRTLQQHISSSRKLSSEL